MQSFGCLPPEWRPSSRTRPPSADLPSPSDPDDVDAWLTKGLGGGAKDGASAASRKPEGKGKSKSVRRSRRAEDCAPSVRATTSMTTAAPTKMLSAQMTMTPTKDAVAAPRRREDYLSRDAVEETRGGPGIVVGKVGKAKGSGGDDSAGPDIKGNHSPTSVIPGGGKAHDPNGPARSRRTPARSGGIHPAAAEPPPSVEKALPDPNSSSLSCESHCPSDEEPCSVTTASRDDPYAALETSREESAEGGSPRRARRRAAKGSVQSDNPRPSSSPSPIGWNGAPFAIGVRSSGRDDDEPRGGSWWRRSRRRRLAAAAADRDARRRRRRDEAIRARRARAAYAAAARMPRDADRCPPRSSSAEQSGADDGPAPATPDLSPVRADPAGSNPSPRSLDVGSQATFDFNSVTTAHLFAPDSASEVTKSTVQQQWSASMMGTPAFSKAATAEQQPNGASSLSFPKDPVVHFHGKRTTETTGVIVESFGSTPIGNFDATFIEAVAAVVIQSTIRRYLASHRSGARYAAVLTIQSFLRTHLAKRKKRVLRTMELSFYDMAAIEIQACFRGWWARDCLGVDHYCATLIQKMMRGYLGRFNYQFVLYRVTIVQSIARRNAAVDVAVNRLAQVIIIQASYRGYRERKRYASAAAGARERRRREEAATEIQSQWRSYDARMNFMHSLADILIVQSVARRWIAMRLVMPYMHSQNLGGTECVVMDEYSRKRDERVERTKQYSVTQKGKEDDLDTNEKTLLRWRAKHDSRNGGKRSPRLS